LLWELDWFSHSLDAATTLSRRAWPPSAALVRLSSHTWLVQKHHGSRSLSTRASVAPSGPRLSVFCQSPTQAPTCALRDLLVERVNDDPQRPFRYVRSFAHEGLLTTE